MISTCMHNFNSWSSYEKKKVKEDYLNGKSIDCIAEECQRHENTVCLELVSQGVMHETSPENVSWRHARFEYGHYDNATDSDEEIESEYDPYDLTVHVNLLEHLFHNIKKRMSQLFSFFI